MKIKTTKDKIITYLLTPFSWIYGCVMGVRNKLYDWGILKSETFDVAVISVGNITIGGTGKTPHVEYLISQLQQYYHIGVVSRGYKRQTKGFVPANSKSTPETIGDEPYQIYQKFSKRVKVAVCESRREGIKKLLEIDQQINLIILDDAFQHRAVSPKLSILLVDYNRPIYEDNVLPLGRLRESEGGINRSDFVIVTKCPENMTRLDYRLVSKKLDLMTYQKLFFSRLRYDEVKPVFEDDARYRVSLEALEKTDAVLLLTGIANPRPLVKYLRKFPFGIRVCHFPDHHAFTKADLEKISKKYEQLRGARKLIITTEKDAVRLACNPYFPTNLKPFTYYVPISVEMDKEWTPDLDFINELREEIDKKGI